MKNAYTSPEQARARLLERSALRPQVEAWWRSKGWDVPSFLAEMNDPTACVLPQVATARYEDVVFYLVSKRAGLTPLWLEFTRDIFVVGSGYKRTLLNRKIAHWNRHQIRPRVHRVVSDLNEVHRVPFRDIRTTDGQSLVDFHHALRAELLPWPVRQHDCSSLYERLGQLTPKAYYPFMFSWFIAHAVLFEDFHGGEDAEMLSGFTTDVVEPAWQIIKERFGVEPIIARIPWRSEYAYYPSSQEWITPGVIPSELLTT